MPRPAECLPNRVLLGDDEPDIRLLLQVVFDRAGILVDGLASNGPEVLEMWRDIGSGDDVAVVLHQRMPGLTGLEVAEQILTESPTATIVVYSGFLDDDLLARSHEVGVAACVSKWDAMDLPNHPVFAGAGHIGSDSGDRQSHLISR